MFSFLYHGKYQQWINFSFIFVGKCTHYVIALKEWVSYFRVESSDTLGSSDIFGSADQPANLPRLRFSMWFEKRGWFCLGFDPSRLQFKLCVKWEGELSLFNNEFVLFCINDQAQVSLNLSNSCFERVSEIFWRGTRFLCQLCAPESNRLFDGNGGCIYPLAFFYKPLRRLHYCRRGNSSFQHADKSIRAILTRVSTLNYHTLVVQLRCFCLCLVD